MMFFTNLRKEGLPDYLLRLFERTQTEVVTLPYRCKPPKGWYSSWMNQFYLYDMLLEMGKRMKANDTLIVSDADCICRKPLDELFEIVRRKGSALYRMGYKRDYILNGTSIEQMEKVYEGCYGEKKQLYYYGGEFIALRGDNVARVNKEYPILWKYNLAQSEDSARLHEEAHTFSVLAARLEICNDEGNKFVKRLWTSGWSFNNVEEGDENLSVWHMPSEKKTGLHRLYRLLIREGGIKDDKTFWRKASKWCGVPHAGWGKVVVDFYLKSRLKIKQKMGI